MTFFEQIGKLFPTTIEDMNSGKNPRVPTRPLDVSEKFFLATFLLGKYLLFGAKRYKIMEKLGECQDHGNPTAAPNLGVGSGRAAMWRFSDASKRSASAVTESEVGTVTALGRVFSGNMRKVRMDR